MNLFETDVIEKRKREAITILFRENDVWHESEIINLAKGLQTNVSSHRRHTEYLLLAGEYSKEETLEAIGGGVAYTVKTVIGMDNKALPFRP